MVWTFWPVQWHKGSFQLFSVPLNDGPHNLNFDIITFSQHLRDAYVLLKKITEKSAVNKTLISKGGMIVQTELF